MARLAVGAGLASRADREGAAVADRLGVVRVAGEAGAAVATRVAAGLGAGLAPPSANALVATAVPRTAAPATAAAMNRTRLAGIKELQTRMRPRGSGPFAWKDVSERGRLSTMM